MITQEQAEEKMDFLLNTDATLANLEGILKACELTTEIDHELAYLNATGANIREKEARAKLAKEYRASKTAEIKAEVEFKTMKYQRQTADKFLDVWRTQESTRRAGV